MKPTKEYIKWLQAHPAVCDALQEHELECWDLFMWEGDVYVVTAVGCDGLYANKHDSPHSWFNTEEDLAGRSLWLPTLGQLVRMLEIDDCVGWDLRRFPPKIYDGLRRQRGMDARPEREYRCYIVGQSPMEFADEPEIACLALWAKVKGVK